MHHDVLEGSCLPEEDIEAVKCIDPATLQTWCMSRVADYRKRIAAVRQRQESLRKEFYTFSDETHDTSSPTANAGHAEEEDPTGISTLGVDELKSRVRALRTLYNTAAPINRYLPAELLMSIFAMLGPTAHRSRRRGVSYPKLFRICRFWRTLLLQATEFWASMLATRHDVTHLSARRLRLYEMALQHSCNRALSLSLYRCPERLVDAIIPHAHRIIELEVTTEECTDDPVVNRLLATAMPMLQRLEVTPWEGFDSPRTYTMSQSTVPSHHMQFSDIAYVHHDLATITRGDRY
ncbi:hypothetical protein C8Q74DRAFT_378678 [Fomes fomentarius]|nr:hypothetical protein C8Q74DRAFT_378678 [Fomes fomentarius]